MIHQFGTFWIVVWTQLLHVAVVAFLDLTTEDFELFPIVEGI